MSRGGALLLQFVEHEILQRRVDVEAALDLRLCQKNYPRPALLATMHDDDACTTGRRVLRAYWERSPVLWSRTSRRCGSGTSSPPRRCGPGPRPSGRRRTWFLWASRRLVLSKSVARCGLGNAAPRRRRADGSLVAAMPRRASVTNASAAAQRLCCRRLPASLRCCSAPSEAALRLLQRRVRTN